MGAVSYLTTIEDNILHIKPNKVWQSGITLKVTLAGQEYIDSFRIPKDIYNYDPEQELYSLGILDTVTEDYLVTSGTATQDEISLLASMGPKLTLVWDKMCELLCTPLTYNGVTKNLKVFRLVGFRRMQQIAFSLDLESLVESVLLTPGPLRDWYRVSYIEGSKPDSIVLQNLKIIEKDISALKNNMVLHNLNTDVIRAIDYEIESSSDYKKLATYIITLFCAIRYTHDNTQFSY